MTPPLQPKTDSGAPLTPALSTTSTLLFSIDPQPLLFKGFTHSSENTRGIPPKSEPKAKPARRAQVFLSTPLVHPLSIATQLAPSNPSLPSPPRKSTETNSPTAHLKG